jgi:hypothetical protein
MRSVPYQGKVGCYSQNFLFRYIVHIRIRFKLLYNNMYLFLIKFSHTEPVIKKPTNFQYMNGSIFTYQELQWKCRPPHFPHIKMSLIQQHKKNIMRHCNKLNYNNCGLYIILWRIDPLLSNDSVNTFHWSVRKQNTTCIARQWISNQAFSTIERLCFLRGPCRGVIKGQSRSFELVVDDLVESLRWQSKVMEKKW